MAAESTETVVKRKRERSPSYPGIDLQAAIERARQMQEKEKKYAAPVNTIFADWGYAPNSSAGFVALAALKKFGLLTDEGSGEKKKARLTDEALAILIDSREDSEERLRLIQEAALKPSIHQELWNKYGSDLPSDASLKYELRKEMNFSEPGANEFIVQYNRTLQFAKLMDSDKLSDDVEDKEPTRQMRQMNTPAGEATRIIQGSGRVQEARRTVALPIGDEWATLEGAFPINEAEWEQMLAMLKAMKPGLVRKVSVSADAILSESPSTDTTAER
jgi:hypothetical protein